MTGDFLLKAPKPLYLDVHVCGSVSFFFVSFFSFSISAYVDFSIGNDSVPLSPPLITKMYLQSYAPVIASGQGGERPIDASLGALRRKGMGRQLLAKAEELAIQNGCGYSFRHIRFQARGFY